jgi:hypothetical protein
MNSTNGLKRTKIKKECIKQKFNWIINTSTLILFFHYTGSKKSNWEIVKKEISKNNFNCKGLVVPSNLPSLLQSNKKFGKGSIDILGSTLLIGCESLEHFLALVEKCKAPTFCCVGGLYGGENMLTHLDIKRCISLKKSLQLQNNHPSAKMTSLRPEGKMCADLLHLLGSYSKNWLLVLQRSLHFHPAPVHLTLHNALSFLALKKQAGS